MLSSITRIRTFAGVPPAFESFVPGKLDGVQVDAQSVQAYYTGALARAAKMTIAAKLDGADVVVEAAPVTVPAA